VSLLRRTHKRNLKPIDEAEAYARCHGSRGDEVRIIKVEPRRTRYQTDVSGERLRAAFENRLDKREPGEEIEPIDEIEPVDEIESAPEESDTDPPV
jgi:hypothetical protein